MQNADIYIDTWKDLVLFSNHLAGGKICFKKSQKNNNLSEWKLSMFGYICVVH